MTDTSTCEIYRPISLLPIGYKLYASILLQRLKTAGAEERIWKTQLGFRTSCGTRVALFLARRRLERAWDLKDGRRTLLAHDWAKAFDNISPSAMQTALQRLGLTDKKLKAGAGIYNGRIFQVRDGGVVSQPKTQEFRIC